MNRIEVKFKNNRIGKFKIIMMMSQTLRNTIFINKDGALMSLFVVKQVFVSEERNFFQVTPICTSFG